jgi:hypothetical protein
MYPEALASGLNLLQELAYGEFFKKAGARAPAHIRVIRVIFCLRQIKFV